MFRTLAIVIAAALVSGLLPGCAHDTPPHERPNVVLIVMDTVRADHLPFYGYARNTAPFLATLASRGTVCVGTQSTSSWTAPATASLLTSLHPLQHAVTSGILAQQERQRIDPHITLTRLPEAVETAAEVFQEQGYETCGITDNLNICEGMGFAQGFTTFENSCDDGSSAVNARVKKWAGERDGARPYFLYIHYMDPHRPYVGHAPWYKPQSNEREDYIARYDSEINQVDRAIRGLYERLGWDHDTIVVVTADHGEEFLDHGGWEHARTLYHEVTTVPLLIFSPDGGVQARRITQPTSLLDVLPTLREAAGLPRGVGDLGVSLLGAARGEDDLRSDRTLCLDLQCPDRFGASRRKAVIREHEKLIITRPDTLELYDLATDPAETVSVAALHPEVVADLVSRLQAFERDCPKYASDVVADTLDAATVQQLKSLGYVR